MTRALCPGCNEFVPVVRNAYWPHWATKIEQLPPLQVIVDLWPCEGAGLPMRECRECGCTELDCSRCIVKTGQPCSWVEDDLCSACVGKEVSLEDYMPGERHQRLHRFGQDLDPRDLPDPLVAPAIEEFRHEILEEDDPPVPLVGIWDPKDPNNPPLVLTEKEEKELQRARGFDSINLADQVDGNDLLHGLADLSGDPKLKKLADEGGVAWATAHNTHVDVEWERQVQQVPLDLSPEDKEKIEREAEDYKRWRERRDRERGR